MLVIKPLDGGMRFIKNNSESSVGVNLITLDANFECKSSKKPPILQTFQFFLRLSHELREPQFNFATEKIKIIDYGIQIHN